MSGYLFLKWFHVLMAITAFGANITYGLWLARADREPQHLAFALRGGASGLDSGRARSGRDPCLSQPRIH